MAKEEVLKEDDGNEEEYVVVETPPEEEASQAEEPEEAAEEEERRKGFRRLHGRIRYLQNRAKSSTIPLLPGTSGRVWQRQMKPQASAQGFSGPLSLELQTRG